MKYGKEIKEGKQRHNDWLWQWTPVARAFQQIKENRGIVDEKVSTTKNKKKKNIQKSYALQHPVFPRRHRP